MSSAHFPQSNGRAEVAVKTAKRLLMSNTGPTGSLDHDRFLRAMLQLRNTPDPDCNISPAQIVFGRPLRDTLSFVNRLEKFSNPHVRPRWRQAWAAKEQALRSRLTRTTESLTAHSRPLRPLALGQKVFLQNQQGTSPTKWDRSGIVVESLGHDQYRVKVDGSGRLTLRNRRFLRANTPVTPTIEPQPMVPPSLSHTARPTAPPPPLLLRSADSGASPSTRPPPCQENFTPLPQAPDPFDVTLDDPSTTTSAGPTLADNTPSGHEPSEAPTSGTVPVPEPHVPPAPLPEPPSPLPAPPRPCRERRPPKRFEPETGIWVQR